MEKVWDWIFKVLSALVIPLLIWGVSLEVRLAVQKSEMARMQEDVKTALSLRQDLAATTTALGKLEVKLDATNTNLTEIKALLRDRP
jgi:hypothetical protein